MTSMLNRRTALSLGVPALAVVFSACANATSNSGASASASGSSSSNASSSGSANSAPSGDASGSASAGGETSASGSASASGDSAKMTATKVGERDEVGYHLNTPKQGAPTVTLYTDYQCPYCAKAEPTYEKVAKDLEGTMNVTVRNMPLSAHKNAVPAAQAVQAAELQDKHLEMANKLFETQDSWKDVSRTDLAGVLLSYAQELGLDEEKFKTDLVDPKTIDLIKGDFEYGQKIGVKGTPQFVVNDKPLENVDSSTSAEDMVKKFKKAAGLN
ncbi:disulfide bond formation protein DsbA [Rothia sp. HMSC08A08]|uniref:DsbA family protein n=1 Tax=Rothia sp. HMSC08A08 TaxID=1581132 RepID=UPI0008A45EE9|nr:thioredoxin domain-containing protein [Rothia sp. HMSC08A08]OFS81648.1 disulfide bond formation protein DsbA [Rothia sp. HMSC08A08]